MTTLQEIEATRQRLNALVEKEPTTPADGVNHLAVISADLERAVHFYRDVLGMALNSVTANRDEPRSPHINIALGRGTMLSLFDFPDMKGQAVQGPAGSCTWPSRCPESGSRASRRLSTRTRSPTSASTTPSTSTTLMA